jgi:hypothetical protein
MTAHIINLDDYREPVSTGNGAIEAMTEVMESLMPVGECLADEVLARLWFLGFKVVPVEGTE